MATIEVLKTILTAEDDGFAQAMRTAELSSKQFNDVLRQGEATYQKTRTAAERYETELNSLKQQLAAGAISQETFNRAVRQADDSLRKANGGADDLSKMLGNVSPYALSAAGGIAAVTAAAYAMVRGISSAIERLDALDDSATKLGISAEGLQGFSKAAALVGIEAQKIEQAIGKMNTNIGKQLAEGGETAFSKQLDKMKVDIMSLNDPEQALLKFADAIAAMKTPAEQASAAVAIFGRAGVDLLPMLKGGSDAIEKQIERLERLGIIIDNAGVKKVGDMADEMAILGQIGGSVWERLTVRASSYLDVLTKTVNKLVEFRGGTENILDDLLTVLSPKLGKVISKSPGSSSPDTDNQSGKSAFINSAAIEEAQAAADKAAAKLDAAGDRSAEKRRQEQIRANDELIKNLKRENDERDKMLAKQARDRAEMERKLADETQKLLEGAMSPIEKADATFMQTLESANRLFGMGRLSLEQLAKIQNAAGADLVDAEQRALGKDPLDNLRMPDKSIAAAERGSGAAFSAIAKASNAGLSKDRDRTEKEQLATQKRQETIQREIAANTRFKPQVARF